MAPILVILILCIVQSSVNGINGNFNKIELPSTGSEALAFDPQNGGPYTGLNDGRILKYQGPKLGFVEFATTVPNRPKEKCDGTDGNDPKLGLICGKPLGMEFNNKTGELYVVDANLGLMVVGKQGGVAKQLSDRSTHFDFADALAIDYNTGVVYIIDVGTALTKIGNMTEILLSGSDRTGRLLKYDPATKQTTVLLTGLAMPAGIALSIDGSFLMFGEYLTCTISKYWLTGPQAQHSEKVADLPGNPDNIMRTNSGDFWVGVNVQKLQPRLTPFPLGQKISPQGQVLETVNLYGEYGSTYITEVREQLGNYYVASVFTNFVGVYSKLGC